MKPSRIWAVSCVLVVLARRAVMTRQTSLPLEGPWVPSQIP